MVTFRAHLQLEGGWVHPESISPGVTQCAKTHSFNPHGDIEPRTSREQLPQNKKRKHSLTYVHHVYIHWVREGAAQSVGGHHGDVVVDPDGRVVLVEEAGVLSCCVVVRTLVHCLWAAREAGEQHGISMTVLYCTYRTFACILHATFVIAR